MLGLAFVLTGNQWVAEDTAQDAFTAAFRRWRSIVAYDSPGAWVRRVTCNRAASVLRRRVREAKALVRLAGRMQTAIELDEGDAGVLASGSSSATPASTGGRPLLHGGLQRAGHRRGP